RRGDFAGQHDQPGIAQGFGRHACIRVLRQDSVENGVGNLIRDFVGMAFGDRFGSKEEIVVCHSNAYLMCRRAGMRLNDMRCTSDVCVRQWISGRDALADFLPACANSPASPRKLSVNSAMNGILSENSPKFLYTLPTKGY